MTRPLSDWSDEELLAAHHGLAPTPWASVGMAIGIAFGIPLVVLVFGASLVWAFSGFAATRP